MQVMAALARCGLLPGAAGDQAGAAGDGDPAQRPARQAGTPARPAPSRSLAEAERRLIAMANEIGVDARDPEALLALIEATIEQFINATGRRR